MNPFEKNALFLLRLLTGWLMFYAGMTKLFNSDWSAAGYLLNAKTFPAFYAWFAQPDILPITNFLNEWGLTLLGLSLIFGVFLRLSSFLGIILMLLYYFPVLEFPLIPPHSFLVDDHIIDAAALLVIAAAHPYRVWSVDAWLANRFPKLKPLL